MSHPPNQLSLQLLLGALLLAGASACNSSASLEADAGSDLSADRRGPTPITLIPADSLFQINGSSDFLVVTVTDVSGACDYVVNRQTKAGARGLVLSLMARPVAPGTYAINDTGVPVQAYYLATDAACNPLFAIMPFARTGTLVLTAVSASEITGSYDVTFGNGMALAGSFRATTCGPLMQLDPTCVP